MSVVFSGTNQGSFIGTGNPIYLDIPAGVDYIRVYNYTAIDSTPGVEFYWQLGMPQGQGILYSAGVPTVLAAGTGFYSLDTSVNIPSAPQTIAAISGAAVPVVTSTTVGLNAGAIVRLFSIVGGHQLDGLDFTVGSVIPATSFTLANMDQIVAAPAPGANASYRIIPFDPLYYPTRRYITKVTQAAQALVTLSVTHGYTVGQVIRFVVPQVTNVAYGMTQLNGVQATIVAVGTADADGSTNTITVDVDTTGFSPFVFPLTSAPGFTPAQVIPMGDNTAESLALNANILSDATVNTGIRGIALMPGASAPGGGVSDVMYWVAGKSFNT
jgi:hypothetical protein